MMKKAKRILVILMALTLVFAMVGCGKTQAKEPATADVMSTIKSQITFPEMSELKMDDIKSYYDVDTSKIKEMSYIIASSGITADEVLIVKMNSEEDANNMKTLMESRKNSVKETAANYTPDELEKLTSAVITTKGSYAIYAATGDNSKAKQLIDSAF